MISFYYSTMNAGKSAQLLLANHSFREKGLNTVLFTYSEVHKPVWISSRSGLKAEARPFYPHMGIQVYMMDVTVHKKIDCIFVDEAQFLTSSQVDEFVTISKNTGSPVKFYGLRTNFKNQLFEGSKRLFEVADELIEIPTICHCGKKATHVLKHDGDRVIYDGPVIDIGGNEKYTSVCYTHYREGNTGNMNRKVFEDDRYNDTPRDF